MSTMANPMWAHYRRDWWCRFLERRGRLFATSLPAVRWPTTVQPGELKECYGNASRLALRFPERFLYCEGLAERISVNFVVEHGWIYDRDTCAVIDPTWGEDGRDYAGVAFSPGFIGRRIAQGARMPVLYWDTGDNTRCSSSRSGFRSVKSSAALGFCRR
jgi:hypothetical protein